MTDQPDQPKEYSITKEYCQKLIDKNGGVCSRCGGPVKPMETVDNGGTPTFWGACEACSVYEWGSNPLDVKIAKVLVHDHHVYPYGHMENPKMNPQTEQEQYYHNYYYATQVGGVTRTVSLVRQYLDKFEQEQPEKQPTETENIDDKPVENSDG